MIWLILGVLLYVAKPLYAKNAPALKADSEIADYLDQITYIDTRLKKADKTADVSALALAKIELQRQVLAKSDADKDAGPQTVFFSVLLIAFTFGAIGMYATLGRPELTKTQELVRNTDMQNVSDLSLEHAVAQLEQRLAQGDQNLEGWMLYARRLMSMERYDDAIGAYEKVLQLTNNDPKVLEEFESAKTYIAEKQSVSVRPIPGPSKEQMQAAAAMTPEARQDMIKGMVAGLSQKLKDNPNDIDGWTRLLRVRKVLGQETEALADIMLLRETYKDTPALAEKILSDTGWVVDE